MNKDTLEGNWKELKGKVKAKWGELTDDELDRISGRSEELSGILQKKYGMKKDQAKQEVDDFMKSHH